MITQYIDQDQAQDQEEMKDQHNTEHNTTHDFVIPCTGQLKQNVSTIRYINNCKLRIYRIVANCVF